jgi:hypothetical protein
MKDIANLGDVAAIPFFIILSFYFANIEHKTLLEWILFWFSVGAFIADCFFTYLFIIRPKNSS